MTLKPRRSSFKNGQDRILFIEVDGRPLPVGPDLSLYVTKEDLPKEKTEWIGTQKQYDRLSSYDNNINYLIIEE